MSKDLLTTIVGMVGAAALAAKEYVAAQTAGEYGVSFYIGLAGAVLIGVFGYWSKKDQ